MGGQSPDECWRRSVHVAEHDDTVLGEHFRVDVLGSGAEVGVHQPLEQRERRLIADEIS